MITFANTARWFRELLPLVYSAFAVALVFHIVLIAYGIIGIKTRNQEHSEYKQLCTEETKKEKELHARAMERIQRDKKRVKGDRDRTRKIKLLEKESERDYLTGLLNYRALSQEINRLANNNEIHNIVIGALDIDHFKKINDTYGHFVGNEVLKYFSTVFREQIHSAFPKHGYVYRFGGEEFTIVVSNHSLEEVYQLLQSIEKFFNNKSIVTKEGMKLIISFSCSLTDRLNDELLDTTLKRADKMLYSVKNNGRGWIVTDQHHQRPQKPSLERKINNNY